jgi:hypothetical protein
MDFNFNFIDILAGLSIVVAFLGLSKIDKTMKEANIDSNIRLKVNSILLILGTIISLLSGYILFFVR